MSITATIYLKRNGMINEALIMPQHFLIPLGAAIDSDVNITLQTARDAINMSDNIEAIMDPDDEGHLIITHYPLYALQQLFHPDIFGEFGSGSSIYITQNVVGDGVEETIDIFNHGQRACYNRRSGTEFFEEVDLESVLFADVICGLHDWFDENPTASDGHPELGDARDAINSIIYAVFSDAEAEMSIESLVATLFSEIDNLRAAGVSGTVIENLKEWHELYEASNDSMYEEVARDMDAMEDLYAAALIGDGTDSTNT